MAKREKLVEKKNNYFSSPKTHYDFVSTGCTLLDCALGGGFALGRVANIVGDKSTSKTGIATECLINFVRSYPDGKAAYRDAEAAFDTHYAAAMGLPVDKIDMEGNIRTVEDLHRDLEKFVKATAGKRGIYILDSLDALSDEDELERDIAKGSFGATKAKKSSEMFRRLTPEIEKSKVLFLVVSQVRDNIGAMMGEKHKRSGGRAMDFYASQIVWLANLGKLDRTIDKIKRVYGIMVKANVKKNKISMPFRQCEFEFHFGYGIEDVVSNLNWLEDNSIIPEIEAKSLNKMTDDEYREAGKVLAEQVKAKWSEVEEKFMPKRSKYG